MVSRLWVLVKRELFQLVSFKALLIAQIIQPAAWLMLYSVGMTDLVQPFLYCGVPVRYIDFVLPGLVALQGFSQLAYTLSRVADEKRHGMFQALLTSGVNQAQYVSAKASSAVLIAFLQCLGIVGVFFLGMNSESTALKLTPHVFILTVMGAILWSSLGTALGTALCSAEKSSVVAALVGLPVMFSSSVFYDLEGAHAVLKSLSAANPLTFYVGALRKSMLFGGINPREYLILGLLTACSFLVACWVVGATDLVTKEK